MDVIKATSAADFLGLVPALIGYTPTRSIVAIPFAGSRTVGAHRAGARKKGHDARACAQLSEVLFR